MHPETGHSTKTYSSVRLKTESGRNPLYLLLITMRPRQWTKNLVIFAGVIFSQKLFTGSYLLHTFMAFICFCVLSGSVYTINDLVDMEKDRAHPKKKDRPLASGRLNPSLAALFVVCTTAVSLAGAFWLNVNFGFTAMTYFMMTLVYSFKLKNIVIIDVLTIAMGFVLRAIAGVLVISVDISPWLLVCTFLLALFLALTKRRQELVLLDEKAQSHRKILEEYRPEMLDQMISVATSSTVMAYSLYTFTSGHSIYLMATIPFVVYGVFRYQYLVHGKDMGGSPEVVFLRDKPLFVNVMLWVLVSAVILYLT